MTSDRPLLGAALIAAFRLPVAVQVLVVAALLTALTLWSWALLPGVVVTYPGTAIAVVGYWLGACTHIFAGRR